MAKEFDRALLLRALVKLAQVVPPGMPAEEPNLFAQIPEAAGEVQHALHEAKTGKMLAGVAAKAAPWVAKVVPPLGRLGAAAAQTARAAAPPLVRAGLPTLGRGMWMAGKGLGKVLSIPVMAGVDAAVANMPVQRGRGGQLQMATDPSKHMGLGFHQAATGRTGVNPNARRDIREFQQAYNSGDVLGMVGNIANIPQTVSTGIDAASTRIADTASGPTQAQQEYWKRPAPRGEYTFEQDLNYDENNYNDRMARGTYTNEDLSHWNDLQQMRISQEGPDPLPPWETGKQYDPRAVEQMLQRGRGAPQQQQVAQQPSPQQPLMFR